MKKGVSFEIESLGDTVIPNTASTASYFKFHSDSERVLYHHLLSKFQGEVDE